MKKVLNTVILMFLASILFACQSEESISISDENLEKAIRTELNIEDDEPINENVIKEIEELNLADESIQQLDGIQHFNALENLDLQNNKIEDFSLLEELENLTSVNVIGNPSVSEHQSFFDNLSAKGVEVTSVLVREVVGEPDGPGGFLWKVENGDTTVYLQGTIHMATEDLFPLNKAIEQAYVDSDVVVPEIDLTNINPLALQGLTMELATFSDGTTLRDHLSSELYTELDTVMQEFNMPLQMMENLQPWFIAQTIQQLMIQQLGYSAGVDEYFLAKADEDNKEIIALETPEEQLGLFANTTMDYQVQMLEESLVDIDEFDAQMKEMLHLYKEGNAEELLDSLTVEGVEMTEDEALFMEALNDNRNYGMAESIVEFLEEDNGDTYFVIVGSLHFLLEPHIISILEDEGYEVEKVL
ncbi:TraB/GumN family protein [Ornithinibacillus halophilus]|uniref:TraB family protein n=1 Tax=Ornithinibacillus halophilus TaxID=930117 RepID=A0A1M5HTX9_9BACI|nr:TraB/GumN family protein [Ornithinibacillus halophilus]SHG19406.1 hypothetical protein SAMN05216225_101955 [Ornithinibacillus halophilus]